MGANVPQSLFSALVAPPVLTINGAKYIRMDLAQEPVDMLIEVDTALREHWTADRLEELAMDVISTVGAAERWLQ